MNEIQKSALINAVSTAFYVIGVSIFLYIGAQLKIGRSNSFLVPVTMLLLLVTSASVTGYLIFGKPVQYYIDGKKKDAISLIGYTLLFFSVITFIAILLLLFFTR